MKRSLTPLLIAVAVAVTSFFAARLAPSAAPARAARRPRAPAPPEPSARAAAKSGDEAGPADAWAMDAWHEAPLPSFAANSHRESGKRIEYEQIGRRPDRPASYDAYLFPVPAAAVVSPYDLDLPDLRQRRGRTSALGHGGVDLAAPRGTPIWMLPLEHQVGDAEVLYVGWLFGQTVVTRHTLREGRAEHDYVLIFGHLQEAAAGVARGRELGPGDIVGYVGDTGSPRAVHLHLEARRVRDGIDPWGVVGWELKARDVSVVIDPRNVLPLRGARP